MALTPHHLVYPLPQNNKLTPRPSDRGIKDFAIQNLNRGTKVAALNFKLQQERFVNVTQIKRKQLPLFIAVSLPEVNQKFQSLSCQCHQRDTCFLSHLYHKLQAQMCLY